MNAHRNIAHQSGLSGDLRRTHALRRARRIGAAAALAAGLLAAASAPARPKPFDIVPGRSIGPIVLGMSPAQVHAAYRHPHTYARTSPQTISEYYADREIGVIYLCACRHGKLGPFHAIVVAIHSSVAPVRGTQIRVGSTLAEVRATFRVSCNTDKHPPHWTYQCVHGTDRTNFTVFNFRVPPDQHGDQFVNGIGVQP